MASGAGNEIYLTGSSAADTVAASYSSGGVTFQVSGASFQKASGSEEGCTISGATATCPAAGLSEVAIAGMGGDDQISASGFPQEVGVTVLGGEGADTLTGGQESEDLLVDGKGNFADTLSGLGRDDALLHQDGADQLHGGEGNDLFLSTSICDGETINGEGGVDNSSWAKGPGVDANLTTGQVGQDGLGTMPACSSSSTPDSMISIEDLEGSDNPDLLVGNGENNQLLGHRGADEFFAGEGEDVVLANSEDSDVTIDCGPQNDRAIIDIPHPGKYEDPAPIECENVREGIPEEEAVVTELVGPPAPAPEPTPVFIPPPRPVDTKPPRTTIAKRPAKLVRARKLPVRVVFRFAAGERGATFRCKLDRRPFKPCHSPRALEVVAGAHVFKDFAIDAAGNRDRTPASFTFRVKHVKAPQHHH
jgi:Ca2+-binding RTX toxin-like protein